MQHLSLDEVFCVLEYLPVGADLSNALLVCKEWNSLDQFEPFWKTILHHYLHEKMIFGYNRMVLEHLVTIKNWDIKKVKDALKAKDVKTKYSLLSALKSCKVKDATFNVMTDKSLLNSVCSSYDSHILKDKTASRESLRKLRLDDEEQEDRSSIIGKRFKHLVERQVHSNKSIITSTYFNSISEVSFEAFFNILMDGEIENKIEPSTEDYNLQADVLVLFLKNYQTLDNSDQFWFRIFCSCLREMPKKCNIQDCELFLKKVINSDICCTLSLQMLNVVFKNFNYYDNISPLITQLLKKMKLDDSMPSLVDNLETRLFYGISKAQEVVKSFKYLENFKSGSEIIEYYIVDLFRACNNIVSLEEQQQFIDV